MKIKIKSVRVRVRVREIRMFFQIIEANLANKQTNRQRPNDQIKMVELRTRV